MTDRRRLFVACAPGLEPLLVAELVELGIEAPAATAGGVGCFGDLATIYRLNLGCGLGLRVLERAAEFMVRDLSKLERIAGALEWERWLSPERGVRVRAHAKRSRLYHTKAIAERIEKGISKRTNGRVSARPDVAQGPGGGELGEGEREPILVQVRIIRDRCTVSVDTTGTLLHKRGWRAATGKAPLREDIARALLRLSGWRSGMALFDPLAGAGTLPIEAATIAAGLPPGVGRWFSCMSVPGFDRELFETVRVQLQRPIGETASFLRASPPPEGPSRRSIVGSDRDAGAVESARANAARAGVGDRVEFVQRSLGDPELPSLITGGGTALISNPPWGHRTGDVSRLRDLYAAFGQLAQRLPKPVHVAIATSDAALAGATKLGLERRISTDHGGIKVGLWTGRVA
jgi:putative N6-adenine-specific DNA methylase